MSEYNFFYLNFFLGGGGGGGETINFKLIHFYRYSIDTSYN